MTIYSFIQDCNDLWPGKELTVKQQEIYGEKLSKYSERELDKILEWLQDNSKFFPKIADIVDAARHCGYLDRVKPYKPHIWEPTDCRLCGGSGQLAVFYEQKFDTEAGCWQVSLKRVMQWQSSETTNRINLDWTRFYFRCCCPMGEAETLEHGLPRWDPNKPSTFRRAA